MAPASGPASQEDFAFISELLETIEYDPGNTQVRWVLAQTYEAYGWLDEAADLMRQVLTLSPGDEEATAWLVAYLQSASETPPSSPPPPLTRVFSTHSRLAVEANIGGEGLNDLENGYKSLITNAQELMEELLVFQEMCPDLDIAGQIADLKGMTEGRFGSVVKAKPPPAARGIADKIKANKTMAVETAFTDLEANARWIRTQSNSSTDQIREAVRKRAQGIKAALPKDLRHTVDTAFMHIEHEVLNKTYQNDGSHTMLGDLISSIPRDNFWVSEDGFAWAMEELASAIKAKNGVMRNPLSNQMFTADDVRAIVQHPLGKGLAALQLKQRQLTRGVRSDTVERLSKLAGILLADQEADSAASRTAVDEFLTYTATLPQAEQDALQDLRVPARDSHTGQAFDGSIGEAVADAKANRQCFHKTGDLLQQAATYLRGAARTSGR